MKRMITLKLTSIASLVLILWSGNAMGQSEEQIKRFNQEREDYFNEHLELTKDEKQAFWPVYNDFNNRKMKIMEEERNTFRYSNKNAENLSEEETKEILAKIRVYKEQYFLLEQEYYKEKFPGVLPSKKVLKLYKVEWDFRKHLVRKLRGEGHGGGSGPQDRERIPMPPDMPHM